MPLCCPTYFEMHQKHHGLVNKVKNMIHRLLKSPYSVTKNGSHEQARTLGPFQLSLRSNSSQGSYAETEWLLWLLKPWRNNSFQPLLHLNFDSSSASMMFFSTLSLMEKYACVKQRNAMHASDRPINWSNSNEESIQWRLYLKWEQQEHLLPTDSQSTLPGNEKTLSFLCCSLITFLSE